MYFFFFLRPPDDKLSINLLGGSAVLLTLEKNLMKSLPEGAAAYVTCDTPREGKWRALRVAVTHALLANRKGTKSLLNTPAPESALLHHQMLITAVSWTQVIIYDAWAASQQPRSTRVRLGDEDHAHVIRDLFIF